jgi:DNA-3-methyladenine glycosylase
MYMPPGTVYVYNIYGLYCCLNVSSSESGGAVLIRALEPISGLELMRANRAAASVSKKKSESGRTESLKVKNRKIASGPAKICMAMMIKKSDFNEVDISECDCLWVQDELVDKLGEAGSSTSQQLDNVVEAKRVGIDYAGELAVNALFRLYLKGSQYVSM